MDTALDTRPPEEVASPGGGVSLALGEPWLP